MAKKKVIKKKVTKRLRRYSPREQQVIMNVAVSLGDLIPATSRGSYCLQNIAKENKLSKYFNEKLPNKKKKFEYFIKYVFGKHPRKFKTIVNNILADAVERRRTQGNPILRDEADKLKENLFELGVDLQNEIDDMELPVERPKVTPPPANIVRMLQDIGLHKNLLDKVMPLFSDGHTNEAVRKSGEIYEKFVARASGLPKKYGRDLMANAFNKDNPTIDVCGYHDSEILDSIDEREGYMYLSMGSMHWCKNIVGHGDIDQLSPVDAASRIILISHLLEIVDVQIIKKENE